jgi:hypothetical protein
MENQTTQRVVRVKKFIGGLKSGLRSAGAAVAKKASGFIAPVITPKFTEEGALEYVDIRVFPNTDGAYESSTGKSLIVGNTGGWRALVAPRQTPDGVKNIRVTLKDDEGNDVYVLSVMAQICAFEPKQGANAAEQTDEAGS